MEEWWNEQKVLGHKLVATWPEELKDGTIFIDENSMNKYLKVVGFSAFLWVTCYMLAPVLIGRVFKHEQYVSRDACGRWNIDNEVVSMVHNFFSVYLSIYAAVHSCGDGDRFPAKDTDWTILRWFFSENCHH